MEVADPQPVEGEVVTFAQYGQVFEGVRAEVSGLEASQLDYENDEEEWSRWGIRRQVSHMAFIIFYWLVYIWGKVLWPQETFDLSRLFDRRFDRRLHEENFWQMADILAKLEEALGLVKRLLQRPDQEAPSFLSSQEIALEIPLEARVGQTTEHLHHFWERMSCCHPSGIWRDSQRPQVWHFTLEGILRHLYWEWLVHLHTILRLKQAQGLPTQVKLPAVGYLAPGGPAWVREEAGGWVSGGRGGR